MSYILLGRLGVITDSLELYQVEDEMEDIRRFNLVKGELFVGETEKGTYVIGDTYEIVYDGLDYDEALELLKEVDEPVIMLKKV